MTTEPTMRIVVKAGDILDERVRETVSRALALAARQGAATVALPALATGYGPLSIRQFAEGLRAALSGQYPGVEELRVVLASEDDAVVVREVLRVS